jgi:uncharacterized BrkB/YihY/UPF0761 family membrane protein
LLFATFIFGLINTQWIYLYNNRADRVNSFIESFGIITVADIFIYEVVMILIKVFIFYIIIRSDDMPRWKRCLVGFIAALPWVFIKINFRRLLLLAK